MLRPVLVTPPAALPVDFGEVKRHSRVDTDDDDGLILWLIDAAVAHLDGYQGILGQALVTQTWAQSWPGFCGDMLRLSVGPVQSVTSVKYFDAADDEQTVSAANYRWHRDALGTYVKLKNGLSWPSVGTRDDAVTVTYVCGHGATAAVPADIKHLIHLLVAHWYEHREAVMAGVMPLTVPLAFDDLIKKCRRVPI